MRSARKSVAATSAFVRPFATRSATRRSAGSDPRSACVRRSGRAPRAPVRPSQRLHLLEAGTRRLDRLAGRPFCRARREPRRARAAPAPGRRGRRPRRAARPLRRAASSAGSNIAARRQPQARGTAPRARAPSRARAGERPLPTRRDERRRRRRDRARAAPRSAPARHQHMPGSNPSGAPLHRFHSREAGNGLPPGRRARARPPPSVAVGSAHCAIRGARRAGSSARQARAPARGRRDERRRGQRDKDVGGSVSSRAYWALRPSPSWAYSPASA